jgi:hypothetical protein
MTFWSDFKGGFNSVIDPVKKITKKIPVIGDVYGAIPRLHKGGRVPKTGDYRLRQGELVMNKTQLARLRKAKSAKTRQKIVNEVSKKRPRKPKKRR